MNARTLSACFGIAALLATTAACSWAVGFDGFEGSASGTDGGRGALNGQDSGAEQPLSDGDAANLPSDAGDAAVDAADPNTPPVFVDGGSFCSTQDLVTFCEDFDTTDLPVHWMAEGVFARLTSYSAKSAPNTLLLDVPASNAGGTFVSKITKPLGAPSTNLVLEFDFLPEKIDLGASFLILSSLEYTNAEMKYSMRLVYTSGSVRLEESNLIAPPNNKDEYHPFFTIPMNKWTRVKLDVVASGASPGATVSLDGVPVGARETLTPTAGMDTTPTLILGAVYAGNPQSGWTLRYDDVTVTYR